MAVSPGMEDVHGEREGKAVVYWAHWLLSGGETAKEGSNNMAGMACSVPGALYQERKSKKNYSWKKQKKQIKQTTRTGMES